MRQGEVDLVVPRLVERREVLGRLLDQRDQDEAHERVRDAARLYQWLDLLHQRDRDEGHERDGDGERDGALGERELGLGLVLLLVVVARLVVLEDGVVDAVVRVHLEPNEDDVRD